MDLLSLGRRGRRPRHLLRWLVFVPAPFFAGAGAPDIAPTAFSLWTGGLGVFLILASAESLDADFLGDVLELGAGGGALARTVLRFVFGWAGLRRHGRRTGHRRGRWVADSVDRAFDEACLLRLCC